MIALSEAYKADCGFNIESQAIWDLVETMSEHNPLMRCAYLQFITGSPKLPIGCESYSNYCMSVRIWWMNLQGFQGLNPPTYCCSQAPRSTTERQPDIGLSFVFHLYTLFIETWNWPVMQKCDGKWIRYWATDGKEDRRSKADHQAIVKEAESCLAMQVRYPEEWMKQQLWRSLVIIGSLARIRCLYCLASNPC